MGRNKINKESLSYRISKLFYKNILKGFQFTAGNTSLGIKENRALTMSCSLIFDEGKSSAVIDGQELDVAEKIEIEVFGIRDPVISMEQLRRLQQQFRNLNYEVEEAEFAGYWYWFRIYCTPDEILNRINNLKENIKI